MIKEQLQAALRDALNKGWSVKGLADAMGIHHSILVRFLAEDEAKQRTPNLETAGRIADFLGMKLTQPRIPAPSKPTKG